MSVTEAYFHTGKGTILLKGLSSPAKYDMREILRQEIVSLMERNLGITSLKIDHTGAGKPFIEGHEEIRFSISHSETHVAAYISRAEEVGIDIEQKGTNIRKAVPHFMNNEESGIFPAPSDEDLHLIWGAKEAAFKRFGGRFGSFRDEITVQSIDRSTFHIRMHCVHGPVACSWKILEEDTCLVWTIS